MKGYRDNFSALGSLVRGDAVHRDLYISDEIFELEQERLFANTWNYIGHSSQIKLEGDYITLDIAGQPLILVRGPQAKIHVLKNRCAHKGAKLVNSPEGNVGRLFRCPYHAWTFKIDGTLLGVPLKEGYQDTRFSQSEAALGLVTVKNVVEYRGFIFAKLNDEGPDFESYFGDSLSSLDNLVDRSPEGELEMTGGVLRYWHDCNWKMYVENLNDTMHPMVAHESSAGTAKRMWSGKPDDMPKPMAIEQYVPFASSYRFFDEMGVRVFSNGHSYSGVKFSIHSHYAALQEYERLMQKAYGAERAREILGTARHNTVYFPNLTIKGAIQSIRVARPIAANKTVLESYTFRLKGAPDELLHRTTNYSRLINSPFSVVGHEDHHAYRSIQEGLRASGNDWISLHRNHQPDEAMHDDLTHNGTSEISMRNQYRAWLRYMAPSPALPGSSS